MGQSFGGSTAKAGAVPSLDSDAIEVDNCSRPDGREGVALEGSSAGSHAWQCFTAGGISRPHSGQIQWNMHPGYTHFVLKPFGCTPYLTHLGTLGGLGFNLSVR